MVVVFRIRDYRKIPINNLYCRVSNCYESIKVFELVFLDYSFVYLIRNFYYDDNNLTFVYIVDEIYIFSRLIYVLFNWYLFIRTSFKCLLTSSLYDFESVNIVSVKNFDLRL